MTFAFEVRESDLMGRLGLIRVGGKTLETPCLFPVIHPVSQAVSPSELRGLGFNGLMTNSYIIYSRLREEARQNGIHRMLGFDGVFMTDSGGYQVLQYGSLEVEYSEVARFQSEIGSELAVTLDRPTGYPQPRAYAKETMEYSLKNAAATLKEFGESATTWVGPIQGGLYKDLVRKSAKSLVRTGFEFLALGSPVQVMQNYMFSDLVGMIVAARTSLPFSMPLHLFGAGHPLTMGLAIALGCDTFDSASYILYARKGRYMTRSGVIALESMKYLPCSCPICTETSVSDLLDMDLTERVRSVSLHNLYILREEMESCKEAISEGRLWDLVEEKSMAHPSLREAFMVFSKQHKLLADGTPLLKDRGLFLRSAEDVGRPEVLAAGKRLSKAFRRRSRLATLLTSGEEAEPPKKERRTGNVRVVTDAYRVHPALGAYPVELDFVYPFTQTVATGGAGAAEANMAAAQLRKKGYKKVKVVGITGSVRSIRSRRGASPSPR